MSRDNGGPAFPTDAPIDGEPCPNPGMSLRDYFAIRAPEPTKDCIAMQMQIDRNRNPYNDSHRPPLRSQVEIRCDLAYEYADAMLKARKS